MSNESLPGEHRIHAATPIDAPVSQVWEVLADFNSMYTWAPNIEDTEAISDVQRGVGAARRNTAKGFGAIDQHVTAWTDQQGFTYRVDAFGPFTQTHTAYRLRPTGDDTSECRLELSFDMRDAPPGKLPTAAQLSAKLHAGLREILDALKHRVETGELVRPHKNVDPPRHAHG